MDETRKEEEKVSGEFSTAPNTQSCGQGELQMRCGNEPKGTLFADVTVRQCHLRKMSDSYSI